MWQNAETARGEAPVGVTRAPNPAAMRLSTEYQDLKGRDGPRPKRAGDWQNDATDFFNTFERPSPRDYPYSLRPKSLSIKSTGPFGLH